MQTLFFIIDTRFGNKMRMPANALREASLQVEKKQITDQLAAPHTRAMRLIRHAYADAANVSYQPAAFALKIGYSKYISEVNGDNREAYRRMLVSISRSIAKAIAS